MLKSYSMDATGFSFRHSQVRFLSPSRVLRYNLVLAHGNAARLAGGGLLCPGDLQRRSPGGLRPAGKANNQVATMTAARPPGSDGKGRDAGWSITARANVSRARRAGKITLPAMKFLDNQETDDQTDGPAQAGGSPSGAAVHRRNRNNRAA